MGILLEHLADDARSSLNEDDAFDKVQLVHPFLVSNTNNRTGYFVEINAVLLR